MRAILPPGRQTPRIDRRQACFFPIETAGGVGVTAGLVEDGFGVVGEDAFYFQTMADTMHRLGQIRGNMEADNINVEKYVKELSVVTTDFT